MLALSPVLLAFAPLGIEHARIGVFAGFASAIYGQIVAGLLGATTHPGGGPRASASLVLGGLVAVLPADPAFAPASARGVERIVARAALAVVLSGVFQIVAGALGAGLFARYVPYPFIAGFMCGAATLIFIAQFTPLTGVTHAELAAGPGAALRALQPVTLFVGPATAAIIFTIAIRITGNLARITSQRMRGTNEILRQLADSRGCSGSGPLPAGCFAFDAFAGTVRAPRRGSMPPNPWRSTAHGSQASPSGYSGSVSPDPPISLGTSFILGSPSLMGSTVSA